jgi:hypothetical protein
VIVPQRSRVVDVGQWAPKSTTTYQLVPPGWTSPSPAWVNAQVSMIALCGAPFSHQATVACGV